ncbi:MAG: DNA recombination protein RmuC [Bacteroidaceae bacterium]|nr:DNA recombination protein RmuC [Bacteroidaceae bacterium]
MEIILAAIAGAALGIFIGYIVAHSKSKYLLIEVERLKWQLDNEKANAELRSSSLQQQIEAARNEAKAQVESLRLEYEKRISETKSDADRVSREMLTAQEERHRLAIKTQQELFDETMSRVTAQVKSATDDMLKQRQKEFTEASNTNLGQIVNPLRETIEKMKQTMSDSTLKHTELSSEMKANLENVMRHSEAAKQSADELARVFKHRSKVQGDWGERVLDELLKSQGLTEGVHYDIQTTIRDASGNVVRTDTGGNMRPDVIMHIDTNREVIIDSKVSLTAFMDYINAESEEERQRHLKAHVDSIQKHVKELSKKDYSSYIKAPKVRMDYVIMFVPHTGALWTALNAQPDLWRKAMEMNVFIADEQTLFAALKMINLTWTHIAQAENHERVYELANEILDRVGKFMACYENIGEAIKRAQRAYDEGGKKLAPSGQSIIQSCAKLEKLGAKQSKRNPILPLSNLAHNEEDLE